MVQPRRPASMLIAIVLRGDRGLELLRPGQVSSLCIAIVLRGDRGLEPLLAGRACFFLHCDRSSGRSRIGTSD